MRVRDLGTLVVEDGGAEHPVVGNKGPAILTMLTIHANEQVSLDALVEAAWGAHPTAAASATLVSHIWRLRQLLEPGRASGRASHVLLSHAGGYRLVGSARTIDSIFLAEASAKVRDLLAARRLEEALASADAALALWRGRPYGPVADAEWAQPAVVRLEEFRAQLRERRIAALVGLGALDTALSDLSPLIAAFPFHENLRMLQMEALHRSGRTEQALQGFQDARRTLVDEVGIEPGRDLQDLHRRILADDPDLAAPPQPVPSAALTPTKGSLQAPAALTEQTATEQAVTEQAVTEQTATEQTATEQTATEQTATEQAGSHERSLVGVHLPSTMTPLVGRVVEVAQLQRLLRRHRLVTICGPAGCGKTRLAVEVARALSAEFDDGVWFVDLVSLEDPSLVVDVVISTIGLVPSADASPVEDLRHYLGARRVLLVLDNCEHLLAATVQMVEEVLGLASAGASGDRQSCILATSRERLGVAGEVGWVLDPLGLPTTGDGAADAAAVQLLVQRLQAAQPRLEFDQSNMNEVVRICVALDGLPLPLELAAARASAFSLAEIADQVSADPGRLKRPGRAARDHRRTLHATIDWSYRLLSEEEQLAHRQLSVLPGAFTEAAAARVLDGAPDEAEDTLVELVHRSMLSPVGPTRPG